jgi:hypothetical protein
MPRVPRFIGKFGLDLDTTLVISKKAQTNERLTGHGRQFYQLIAANPMNWIRRARAKHKQRTGLQRV